MSAKVAPMPVEEDVGEEEEEEENVTEEESPEQQRSPLLDLKTVERAMQATEG